MKSAERIDEYWSKAKLKWDDEKSLDFEKVILKLKEKSEQINKLLYILENERDITEKNITSINEEYQERKFKKEV